ncbi:ZNHI3 protein, partial [Smithornis capensis]|nr:ZNHI3 protein [Smithornis capensis]
RPGAVRVRVRGCSWPVSLVCPRSCSVRCCRSHGGKCPPAAVSAERERAPPAVLPGPAQRPWDMRDRVPLHKLRLLGDSEELRGSLLRQLLLPPGQAKDKGSLLRSSMREPLFLEFADCCLGVVEPPEKGNVLPE